MMMIIALTLECCIQSGFTRISILFVNWSPILVDSTAKIMLQNYIRP